MTGYRPCYYCDTEISKDTFAGLVHCYDCGPSFDGWYEETWDESFCQSCLPSVLKTEDEVSIVVGNYVVPKAQYLAKQEAA